jgi:hypothetical protein
MLVMIWGFKGMYLMFGLLERLGNFGLGLRCNGFLACSLGIDEYVLLNIFGIFLYLYLGLIFFYYYYWFGLFIIIKVYVN